MLHKPVTLSSLINSMVSPLILNVDMGHWIGFSLEFGAWKSIYLNTS
jgi:hypothetical protein